MHASTALHPPVHTGVRNVRPSILCARQPPSLSASTSTTCAHGRAGWLLAHTPPAHLSAVHARTRAHDAIKTALRIPVALSSMNPPVTPPHARGPPNRCKSARLPAGAAL
ncbi:hypothetical protein DFH09DRAFT_1325757 [Mycena vulgaris]|nr:hypothetical protein DFH09DRAFT_1325757 [Mycena vulgaris]